MCKECKGQKEHKGFKEYKMPYVANGDKMFYESWDDLTDDLKDKFKCEATRLCDYNRSKRVYVDFINKLNAKGDELISDYVDATTKVRIHYGKCGHIHPEGEGVMPSHYKREIGCGICNGKIVVKGCNDIATTDPHMVEYFLNIEDTYTHTRCSHDKVEMKCPICGTIKVMCISNLVYYGFGCPKCGDGIKRPEKVLALLLDSLNIKFKKQLKFDGYRFLYDFYLIDYSIIIEVHGSQHYNLCRQSNWKSYEEEHENDLIKYDIAVLNGYEYNKNYFVIDARESNIEWLRNNINNCLFFQQFDLSNIDWKEIDKQTQKSLKVEVCLYWKEQKETDKDLTTATMAEMFNVARNTIRTWLTWGNKNGLCTYNGEEELKAKIKRVSKFVYLVKPDGTKWYDEAMSQNKLSKLTGISDSVINRRLKDGKPLGSKGATTIKYDSKYIGSYVVDAD